MVNKCSAFGCRSGYANSSTPDTVTLHSFPLSNPSLLEKWKKANPRQDFEPTKHSRLCSLHFTAEDFVVTTQDSNLYRKKTDDSGLLKCRYLKPDAVPTVFANAPKYLSSAPQAARSTFTASSSARLENDNMRLQDQIDGFFANDSILGCTAEELQDLLDSEGSRPSGFQTAVCSGKLCIFMLEILHVCQIACSIVIGPSLEVSVDLKGSALPKNRIAHLVGKDGKVHSVSEILNLMARVKGLKEGLGADAADEAMSQQQSALFLDMAEDNLTRALELQDDRSVAFLREQLHLRKKPKTSRRYSQPLLVLCYMIYSISAAAYGLLREQDILCMPSERTLRSVTRKIGKDGLDSLNYLRLRASKLSHLEKVVVLMIDEIYVANRIEYTGGKVSGVDENGSITSTYCCFMIRSVAGKFRDMVSMYPVATLTLFNLYLMFFCRRCCY